MQSLTKFGNSSFPLQQNSIGHTILTTARPLATRPRRRGDVPDHSTRIAPVPRHAALKLVCVEDRDSNRTLDNYISLRPCACIAQCANSALHQSWLNPSFDFSISTTSLLVCDSAWGYHTAPATKHRAGAPNRRFWDVIFDSYVCNE